MNKYIKSNDESSKTVGCTMEVVDVCTPVCPPNCPPVCRPVRHTGCEGGLTVGTGEVSLVHRLLTH